MSEKKLTEKEKANLSDEERLIYFDRSMRRWARKLVVFRNGYRYFVKNKGWILSLLFVLSILSSSIWYALFGVNILAYSSLQDVFIMFAEYFISIIIIGILLMCLYLFYPEIIDNKYEKITIIIFSAIFLIAISWVILSLYRNTFSILDIFFILPFFYFVSRTRIAFFHFSFLFLLLFALLLPLLQYSNVRGREGRINSMMRSAHYDYVSFEYNDIDIDTKKYTYYLIGCNSNYFFILDQVAQETLIIPKSECKNIKSRPFGLKNLLFLRSKFPTDIELRPMPRKNKNEKNNTVKDEKNENRISKK